MPPQLEFVANGAHGRIYKSTDAAGEPIAIKFIGGSTGDASFIKDQAEALKRIDSENVVKFRRLRNLRDPDTGEVAPAIEMEWIEGRTLEKVLKRDSLSIEKARWIGLGLIDGLAAIHAEGIVHRDLYPRNVMVGDHVIKIIDLLYYGTLAELSGDSRTRLYRSDRRTFVRFSPNCCTLRGSTCRKLTRSVAA